MSIFIYSPGSWLWNVIFHQVYNTINNIKYNFCAIKKEKCCPTPSDWHLINSKHMLIWSMLKCGCGRKYIFWNPWNILHTFKRNWRKPGNTESQPVSVPMVHWRLVAIKELSGHSHKIPQMGYHKVQPSFTILETINITYCTWLTRCNHRAAHLNKHTLSFNCKFRPTTLQLDFNIPVSSHLF